MKRKLKKYLLGIIVLILGFITYEILRTKAIFNNSQTVSIATDEKHYLQIINELGLNVSGFIEKLGLGESDSIFTFETMEHVGLLWVISDLNNFDIGNCSFHALGSQNNENGTYANYVSEDPSLSISYRKSRKIALGSHPKIYLSNNIEPVFIQKQQSAIWQISDQYSIEFKNDRSQLVYRTDFIYPTEVFLSRRSSSLNVIFLQKNTL